MTLQGDDPVGTVTEWGWLHKKSPWLEVHPVSSGQCWRSCSCKTAAFAALSVSPVLLPRGCWSRAVLPAGLAEGKGGRLGAWDGVGCSGDRSQHEVRVGLETLPATKPAVEPPWHVPGGAEPCPQPAVSQKYPQEFDLVPSVTTSLKSGNRFQTLHHPSASRVTLLGTTTASWLISRRCFFGGAKKARHPPPAKGGFVTVSLNILSPVFTYSAASKETCAQHHGRCSPHAFCTDYSSGFCCHCRATFYGNGRQCLPEGTRGGRRGRAARAWVATARGARLPAQGPCIASTAR